uniref:Uncharacterized protein n=1 Tax=Labrus bergylta TaxID=56723 RepID=A0A3Q3FMY7_9LABR
MCDQKKKGVDLGDDEDELSVSDDSEPEERPTMAPFDPELDHSDDDDDNEEVCCAPAGLRNQAQFSLRGGSSAFSNRSQSIFDCLDNVARPPPPPPPALLFFLFFLLLCEPAERWRFC